jgi:putative NIF3 family GTP cyclohydrolase 1 type 2
MADIHIAQATPAAPGRGAAPVNGSGAANAPPPGFGRGPAHTGPVPAVEFLDRIRQRSGVPTRPQTLDRVVAGDVTADVTGIACMALATFDGLKAAAAAGRNLVIVLEDIWWSDNDDLQRLEGNSTYKAKRAFIRDHNLVVARFGDHIADMKPNPIAMGMSQQLGWADYAADKNDPVRFTLPPTNLLALTRSLGEKLNSRTLRAVGDPKLPVSKVGVIWGNANQLPCIRLLNTDIDTLLVGYTHEWEAVMYAQDQVAVGMKKSLIALGQAAGEQAGMQYFATWLKTIIDEVPVDYVPIVEPYWNLNNPVNLVSTKI